MEHLLTQWQLLLVIASRVAGVTTASPVFRNSFLLPQLRVFLTLLLAVVMLPAASYEPGALDGARLVLTCVLELVVGLVIGFLGQLVFAVVQMAGAMLDVDTGLSMAQIVDPVSSRSEPVLGAFFQTVALMLYFALDAHHWLLRGLAGSYQALPAGGLTASATGFQHVVLLFGAMLAAAVKMVLPFIAVMLLTTAVLAGVNRAVQQIQLFQLGMGVKAVAGFLMLALVLPYFLGFLEPLFAAAQDELPRTLQLMRSP